MRIIKLIITLCLFLFLSSCDKGLEPPKYKKPAVLIGKVKFLNDWPPEDSVFAIRAAAFKSPPSQDLVSEVLNGNAYFNFESLGYGLDSAAFQFEIDDLPVTLKYIIIAWQYEDTLSYQRVVGVYTLTDKNNPSEITLEEGDSTFIDIEVDWNALPPQPF